jgi:hypothetical protein
VPTLRPGSELRLLGEDNELAGTIVLDEAGAAVLPYCGRVVFAYRDDDVIRSTLARCLIEAGAYTTPPLIRIDRAPAASARVIVGPRQTPRDVAIGESRVGIVAALSQVVIGPPASPLVQLRRRGAAYVMDVGAIVHGLRPDTILEPDDVIVIEEDVSLRPATPRNPGAYLGKPDTPSPTATCGDLVLEHAVRDGSDKGPAHHEVVAFREALVARCSADPDPGASLVDACRRVKIQRTELTVRYAERHPTMVRLAAELRSCPADLPARSPPALSTPEECAHLREERSALVAAGKGERHPSMVSVDVRLRRCTPER